MQAKYMEIATQMTLLPTRMQTSNSQILLPLLSHVSCVQLCATPQTAAHQAPRQDYWSGLPFPSPVHESEKGSRSVVSHPSRSCGLQPTRLLRPWDFPGKSAGEGCHCLFLSDPRAALKQSPTQSYPPTHTHTDTQRE